MDRFLSSGFGLAFMIFVSIIVVCLLVFVPVCLAHKKACTEFSRISGHKCEWTIWTDCLVNINGTWMPLKNVQENTVYIKK